MCLTQMLVWADSQEALRPLSPLRVSCCRPWTALGLASHLPTVYWRASVALNRPMNGCCVRRQGSPGCTHALPSSRLTRPSTRLLMSCGRRGSSADGSSRGADISPSGRGAWGRWRKAFCDTLLDNSDRGVLVIGAWKDPSFKEPIAKMLETIHLPEG